MSAARIFARHPELEEKIENGSIKLSQLAKIQKCVRLTSGGAQADVAPDSQSADLFQQLENKNGFETDKILANEFEISPKLLQKISQQQDGTIRVELSMSAEQYLEIKKAQAYVSHAVPGNDLAELFTHLAVLKNKQVEGKNKTTVEEEKVSTQSFSAEEISPSLITRKRMHLRRTLKRRLLTKAKYRCEHVHHDGSRCDSKYQLQIDHVMALSLGGKDSEENMRILCGVHNRQCFSVDSGKNFRVVENNY